MRIFILQLLFLTTAIWTAHANTNNKSTTTTNNKKKDTKVNSVKPDVRATCADACQEIEVLRKAISDLSKQVMMQQLAMEERSRVTGYSGVQVIRGTKRGPRNYHYTSFLSPSAFTMHDHSNYDRTVGYGEVSVFMNGINFRTRHNDFKLIMPSTKSRDYHAYEDIPFPGVPPEVLKKTSIQDQITELRQWFYAFQKQDRKIRDYTKYFKPVLCYMEGAWTTDKEIQEPFPSDRHSLEAKSWDDLHERFRFTVNTGVKSRLENSAYLPTSIMKHDKVTGLPEYGQWNYRILCNPIKKDIPLSYFQQLDDLTYRAGTDNTVEEVGRGRAARFILTDPERSSSNYQLLDELFADIPGKNNHGSYLNYTIYGEPMYETAFPEDNVQQNSAYYHRSYKTVKNGAGGIDYTAFGFNDENLWVAQTTQPRVAGFQTDICHIIINKEGRDATRCSEGEMKMSYAIPLEVIYLTPLLSWNPHNLVFNDDSTTSIKDRRNGGPRSAEAFNGTDKAHFYMTPHAFFTGNLEKADPADTVKSYVYVLDRKGVPQKVTASGTRIVLQDIEGIGKIRLRYPITPVSSDGSNQAKELNALKDMAQFKDLRDMTTVQFEMSLTTQDPPGEHTHEFSISKEQFDYLIAGDEIKVTTQQAQEHTHDLTIVYVRKQKKFKYILCDGNVECTDGHVPLVTLVSVVKDFP